MTGPHPPRDPPGADVVSAQQCSPCCALDVDRLGRELRVARRRGVRDSRLIAYAPGLVELLYPAGAYPGTTAHERAMATENLITAAIAALGGQTQRVLLVLFGLDPDTAHLLLVQRRQIAAQQVGVLPATWERGWWEPQLVADLAARICRLHWSGAQDYLPRRGVP